jgi:hypothetical protein
MFFSHVPYTGGSAFSWHLMAAFSKEAIAPRSFASGPAGICPCVPDTTTTTAAAPRPQALGGFIIPRLHGALCLTAGHGFGLSLKKPLKEATCDPDLALGKPIGVIFGHTRPAYFPEHGLQRPVQTITILRDPRERRLRHVFSTVVAHLQNQAASHNKDRAGAAKAALQILQPGTKSQRQNSEGLKPLSTYISRYSWLEWFGHGQGMFTSKLGAETSNATLNGYYCIEEAATVEALQNMPWVGVLSHWAASVRKLALRFKKYCSLALGLSFSLNLSNVASPHFFL